MSGLERLRVSSDYQITFSEYETHTLKQTLSPRCVRKQPSLTTVQNSSNSFVLLTDMQQMRQAPPSQSHSFLFN